MPCWYWEAEELLNTPSYRDGVERQTESKYRCEGAKFILQCGQDLGLTYNTIATGIVFFHRFYMAHSFKKYDRYVVAACALFLAGKVEETPKLCRDLVRSVQKHLDERTFAAHFASQTQGRSPAELVMQTERLMLRTLKFDFIVEHPYKHLLEMGRRLRGSQEEISTIVRHAWAFVNDSLYTTLCLQWEPEIIACSVLYLGSLCSSFPIRDWEGRSGPNDKWWSSSCPGSAFPSSSASAIASWTCTRAITAPAACQPPLPIATVTIIIAIVLAMAGAAEELIRTAGPSPPPTRPPSRPHRSRPAACTCTNRINPCGDHSLRFNLAVRCRRRRPSGGESGALPAPSAASHPARLGVSRLYADAELCAHWQLAPVRVRHECRSAASPATAASSAAHGIRVSTAAAAGHVNHSHFAPFAASASAATSAIASGRRICASAAAAPATAAAPPRPGPDAAEPSSAPAPAVNQSRIDAHAYWPICPGQSSSALPPPMSMPMPMSTAAGQMQPQMQQPQQFPRMPIGNFTGQQRPQQHPNKNLHSLT
ncbi:hypothetical protein BOX15_Mlig018086g2 [Macrostomum lignano]|uniref:Cyclin-like domain-containing protein n=1 Tax=Macrostomum lignano TaxID=282301 RepID=A0A267GW80_9PLAT|nr:hypothetical protein BOX15_Mlig018086g2 [Macrostomum lignano]